MKNWVNENLLTKLGRSAKSKINKLTDEEMDRIRNYTNLDNSKELSEHIFWIINDLTEYPNKCKHCGGEVTKYYHKYQPTPYKDLCSIQCVGKYSGTKTKIKKTVHERFNGKHHSTDPGVLAKREKTNMERYGAVHNWGKGSSCLEQIKQTNTERFGCENPFGNEKIKEKIKETNLEKYGCENPQQNELIREKTSKTNLEKYGNICPLHNEEITKQIKETNLERYGFENSQQNKEIKEKTTKTNLERYGNKCPLHNKVIVKQVKQTNMERYGVEHPQQNNLIREKTTKTNLERYGNNTPLCNNNVKQKGKETNLGRYGTEFISQSKHHRKIMEESNNWLPLEEYNNYKLYKREVLKYTNREPTQLLENIENRGKSGMGGAYQLDHRVSKFHGFKNGIPPYIIGNICNLEMIPWLDNVIKHRNSSITIEELFMLFFKNYISSEK